MSHEHENGPTQFEPGAGPLPKDWSNEAQQLSLSSGLDHISQDIFDKYAAVPSEMKSHISWICWRFEVGEGSTKLKKVPYNPIAGVRASVTNPQDWTTFYTALSKCHLYDGLGFVFSETDPFTGIDLDDTNGDAEAFEVQGKVFESFPSYAETSPSGQGLHIIVNGDVPSGRRRGGIEVYSTGRFFTVTGTVYRDLPIADCQSNLNILWAELGGAKTTIEASQFFKVATEADDTILQRAFGATNGDKLSRIWNGDASDLTGDKSGSAIDMALVDILAFYTSDPTQIERLWLSSPQGQRAKTQTRQDYRQRTIRNAFDRHLATVSPGFTVNGQTFGPQPAPAVMPTLLDAGDWDGTLPPLRKYIAAGWIASGQVTFITGKGASGKSLLGQLLATCAAIGCPFLGLNVELGVSLYITCEDDAGELHRRQIAICKGLGQSLKVLRRQMGIVSLVGAIGNELATFDRNGVMHVAPAYGWLAATIKSMGASLVILDNTAHFFAGDENNRHQVAAFVGLLNSLASTTGAAVVLIGHPNKSGAGYSGSTAWENQVRTRLFLSIPENPDGSIPDMDARVLDRAKANYGRAGDVIKFRWHNHTFIADADLPPDVGAAIAANKKARTDNETFLKCLMKVTEQRRTVSHNKGTNYAPAKFAAMPEAEGCSRLALERAMERLFHRGQILADQFLWNDAYRKPKHGLKAVEKCGAPPAVTPSGDLLQPPSQTIDNAAVTLRAATPLYTTYIDGGASEGPPPSETTEGDAPMA